MRGHERAVRTSSQVYRTLLCAYPRELRDEYGSEMTHCFRDLYHAALRDASLALVALWARTLPELLYVALKERSSMLNKDTYRAIVSAALATALILPGPLLAMRITDEVVWSLFDFAGALIFGTGLAYVLVTWRAGNTAYRAAVGVALAAAFLPVWLTGAVGVIGTEDNSANLMYFGVLTVGIIGAIIARSQPQGMARALFATALAQTSVAVIALIAGLGYPWSGPLELSALNGFFIALFVGSALLFRYAARGQTPVGAEQEG